MTTRLAKARGLGLRCFREWQRGLMMTRSSAASIIAICGFLFIAVPALAQSEQGAVPSCPAGEVLKNGLCVPDQGKCFPWQEFREGDCVAKPVPTQVAPPQVAPPQP